MEVISKLFDITKLPSKFFAWALLLCGTVLFLPSSIASKLHLDAIPTEYLPAIGGVFVGAAAFLLVNLTIWLLQKGKLKRERAKRVKNTKEALLELDEPEKAVLREFYFQNRNTIELPADHPAVVGLRNKGLIQLAGSNGYASLSGSIFPFALTKVARGEIQPGTIGWPTEGSEDARATLENSRPNFMRGIDQRDRLRAGI